MIRLVAYSVLVVYRVCRVGTAWAPAVMSVVTICSLLHAGPAFAQKSRALIVATSEYDKLRKPALRPRDLREVADGLRNRGFDVLESYDQRSASIRAQFTRFAKRIAKDDFALIIFAGHMISARGGMLYLPKETRSPSASEVFRRGIPMLTFAGAAARGRNVLMLMLTTDPHISSAPGELVPYPSNVSTDLKNALLAFSVSRNVPVSEIDDTSRSALIRLRRTIASNVSDGRELAAAVAGRGSGLIIGKPSRLPFSNVALARPGSRAGGGAAAARFGQPPRRPPAPAMTSTAPNMRQADEAAKALARRQASLIAKLRQDVAKAETALREAEGRAGRAATQVQSANQRAHVAERAAAKHQAETARLTDELLKLQSDQKKYVRARDQAEKHSATVGREAEAASARAERDRQARLAAEQRLSEQKAELADLADQLAKLQAAAAEARQTAEQERTRAAEFQQKVKALAGDQSRGETAREAANQRALQAEKRATSAERLASNAEQRAIKAEQRLDALKAAKRAAEQKIEELTAAADSQQRELTALSETYQHRLNATEAELRKLKKQAEQYATYQETVNREVQARKSAEQSAAEVAEQLQAAEQRAQEAMSFAQIAAERLRSQSSEAADTERRLRAELESLRETVNELKKLLAN